jgi:hypothetical protein
MSTNIRFYENIVLPIRKCWRKDVHLAEEKQRQHKGLALFYLT